jgi:hypothetical protein
MTMNELEMTANTCIKLSQEYAESRYKSAEARVNFEILLVASMLEFRQERKGIGYEMACLRLMENNETAQTLYREWKNNEARYKGLERLIKANETKISFGQSKIKAKAQELKSLPYQT